MKRFFAIVACLLAASLASAQSLYVDNAITRHQRAMSGGTVAERVAAANELGQAIVQNDWRPDAVLRAYEAGQTLCVYAACQGAGPIAKFAADRPVPQDLLSTSDVGLLKTYSDWMNSGTPQTRAALDEALTASASVRATPLSVIAFQTRYTKDSNAGDWAAAAVSAAEAAQHFAPNRSVIGERWSDAVLAATTAHFNHAPNPDAILRLATHTVELVELERTLGTRPEWLEKHAYTTRAWQEAMSAYYRSASAYNGNGNRYAVSGPSVDQIAEEADAILANAGKSDLVPDFWASEDSNGLPFCDGKLSENPDIRFPRNAGRAGTFGSVIMRISIDDLDVTDVEVLAAVPAETFEKPALKAVRKKKWIVENGTPGVTCSTSQKDMMAVVWFLIR